MLGDPLYGSGQSKETWPVCISTHTAISDTFGTKIFVSVLSFAYKEVINFAALYTCIMPFQVLDQDLDLRTVKYSIWKSSGDMRLYYREVNPPPKSATMATASDEKIADKADLAKADDAMQSSCNEKEKEGDLNQGETEKASSVEDPPPTDETEGKAEEKEKVEEEEGSEEKEMEGESNGVQEDEKGESKKDESSSEEVKGDRTEENALV